jgi:Xaa-Pro aminopeptidase
MAPALLIYGDPERSMDLFHTIPAAIADPFLYAEVDGRRVAVVPHIDHQTVREVDPSIELLDPYDLGRRALLRQGLDATQIDFEIALRACRQLGVDRATVSWDFPVAVADRLRADGLELRIDHKAFEARRRAKSPAQLAGIRRAQHAANLAMGLAADLVREARAGLTAEDVRAAMAALCAEHDAELPADVIVAVNGQAANGHDSGSGPIAAGDTVLIDIWPRDRASRCWADMTRTFVAAGEAPSAEIVGYWRLAHEALEAVTAAVRPGVLGRDLHGIASEVFETAGEPTVRALADGEPLPDRGFLHSLGHGVGLEVHEAPGLGLAGADTLVAGDVLAVEPGCYRQGVGGVRLEDLVLVTEEGGEVLTDFPYEL